MTCTHDHQFAFGETNKLPSEEDDTCVGKPYRK